MNNNILIIGNCGVGKTWVMKNILNKYSTIPYKLGMFCFHEGEKIIVVGKYDGSVFEGSDKLSMAIMKDLDKFINYISKKNKIVICEGDRFMNNTYLIKSNPFVINISGDGFEGRKKRNSKQTQQHLKRISTRVNKTKKDIVLNNSNECLEYLIKIIDEKN
jgi:hypothetical protein